jgi:hypothetical protein
MVNKSQLLGMAAIATLALTISFLFISRRDQALKKVAPTMPAPAATSPANLRDGPFVASSTNFGLYGQTACGCSDGVGLIADLATIGWYGAATPAWLGSPYSSTYPDTSFNCGACPDQACNSAVESAGTPYNNCASGPGGCMQCMELTVLDTPNVYGQTTATPGTIVNAIVIDNCEMSNQYGNNEQWCVPFSAGVPTGGCQLGPEPGDPSCSSPVCKTPTTDSLTQAAGKWADGTWDFSAECGTIDAFSCTNGAGQPAHVDLALQQISTPPWTTGDNPVVSVKYISCPAEVTDKFMAGCASQSGTSCSYSS